VALYGMSQREIREMIAAEFQRLAKEQGEGDDLSFDELLATTLTHLIHSVGLVIERNNAQLAQQIIEELRKG
jgi:hypothetical protein